MKFLVKHIKILVQSLFALLFNLDLPTFFKAIINKRILISQWKTKQICIPGLHCYSCPSAVGACPVGSFQFWLNDVAMKWQLAEKINLAGLYIVGSLALLGSVAGRFFCGWICPFGFLQDLINKITAKNIRLPAFFKYFRYISLFIFVLLLPVLIYDIAYLSPWFCKLLCPAGTLTAGIPLLLISEELRQQISYLTFFKFGILFLFLFLFFISRRAFCKTMCPLGAFWGFFNKVSLYQLKINKKSCINCNKCSEICPMNIDVIENPASTECIRCLECKGSCPVNSITFENGLSFFHNLKIGKKGVQDESV